MLRLISLEFAKLPRWLPRSRLILAWLAGAVGALTPLPASVGETNGVPSFAPLASEDIFMLDLFTVDEGSDNPDFDPTGLDGDEIERVEAPFGSDLLFDVGGEDLPMGELDAEMNLSSGASAVDVALGGDRLNLRGFPTPMRRNGFTQSGFPEVINIDRSETILGPLTPITGLAAPGGIRNFLTGRPRGRNTTRLDVSASTDNHWRVQAKTSGTLQPKKAWHLASVGVRTRRGPQSFAESTQSFFSGALALKHSRRTSTLWQLDWFRFDGNPAPSVVEYRPSVDSRLVGPYRPLVDFHAAGPNAGVRRDVLSFSGQLESQLRPGLSLRAGAQWFGRDIEQERFTTGQYVLETGKFSGVREPMHVDQAFNGLMVETNLTWRVSALKAEHKVSFGVENTWVRGNYEQRALMMEDRQKLPESVRFFDPAAPDYERPAYDPALYRRMITDRDDELHYSALVLSSRTALHKGRTVLTTGLRQDFVDIEVRDTRPTAAQPHVADNVGHLSFHGGANHTIARGRALIFANVSSAFEPSTRVDARTGEIQGNETTFGYETGARTVLLNRRLSLSVIGFQYFNENIARRNPLYDDPIADADERQPQLVSGGEERFTGGALQAGWKPSATWTITGRTAYTRAITTASPDMPEEIGRALTRLPALTTTGSVRYSLVGGPLAGVSLGASAVHVGDLVAHYQNSVRERLDYPAYTLLSANVGYGIKRGRHAHQMRVGVSNALDTDLVALLARPGSGREFNANYSVTF
ncbi:MAG TPA: TonB-dependent receptor [Opitutus sp.]|nr:TonB-dependent receptor [Opitutus sp.]